MRGRPGRAPDPARHGKEPRPRSGTALPVRAPARCRLPRPVPDLDQDACMVTGDGGLARAAVAAAAKYRRRSLGPRGSRPCRRGAAFGVRTSRPVPARPARCMSGRAEKTSPGQARPAPAGMPGAYRRAARASTRGSGRAQDARHGQDADPRRPEGARSKGLYGNAPAAPP